MIGAVGGIVFKDKNIDDEEDHEKRDGNQGEEEVWFFHRKIIGLCLGVWQKKGHPYRTAILIKKLPNANSLFGWNIHLVFTCTLVSIVEAIDMNDLLIDSGKAKGMGVSLKLSFSVLGSHLLTP